MAAFLVSPPQGEFARFISWELPFRAILVIAEDGKSGKLFAIAGFRDMFPLRTG
jgi:hypothetical protein